MHITASHAALPAGATLRGAWLHIEDAFSAEEGTSERVADLIARLSATHADARPSGILIGDATGRLTPYEAAPRVLALRRAMQRAGWGGSALLVRTYHATGLAAGTALEALAAGCDGVWSGVTDACKVVESAQVQAAAAAAAGGMSGMSGMGDMVQGASTLGAASSLLTLVNLARLGNTHVARMYDLPKLREAAVVATHAVTGRAPAPRAEVVGARALDVCFDPCTSPDHGAEAVAALLGVRERVARISQHATPHMVAQRLLQTFGQQPHGDDGSEADETLLGVAARMVAILRADLLHGVKEDYDSTRGLAALWRRAGGATHTTTHTRSVAPSARAAMLAARPA